MRPSTDGAARKTKGAARDAKDHPALETAVRIGLVAYGVVHLLIGWLALKLALGDSEGSADKQGALQQVAETPLGAGLLWVLVAGFIALIVWQLIELLLGSAGEDGAKEWLSRAGHGLKIVIFASLAFTSAQVAGGSSGGSGGSSTEETWTAELMQWSLGPILVGIGGAITVGYGIKMMHKGWREKFREQLAAGASGGQSGSAIITLGKAGYIAKGIAVAILGGLFVVAAVEHDPQEAGGLDDALTSLASSTLGSVLLGVIAVGLGCYGLYCVARARYLSL